MGHQHILGDRGGHRAAHAASILGDKGDQIAPGENGQCREFLPCYAN